MILALLLTALSPAEHGPSQLVEEGHEHDWALLESMENGEMWWDRNSVETRDFAEGKFRTVLLRSQFTPDRYPRGFMDVVIAIDCKNITHATVAAAHTRTEEALEKYNDQWTAEGLEFSEFAKQDIERKETQDIMIAACGDDWAS